MRKRSWDEVHRVGTDLTALFAIVLPAGRNFTQAPDFHDFSACYYLFLPKLGEISPSFPVTVNLASFSTVSSLLDSSSCF